MAVSRFVATLFFFISCLGVSYSQKDKELPAEQVDVIKSFEVKLLDVSKLKLDPSFPVIDTTTVKQEYTPINTKVNVNYDAPALKPLAMPVEPLQKAYNGYAKAGYGIPSSPFLEASYHYNMAELDLIAKFKHHSANFRKIENQRFSDNDITLDGTYYFPQGFALNGKTNYSFDKNYFYGYDHSDTSFTADQAKQRFRTFDFDINFFNGPRNEGDINYLGALQIYRHTDNFDAGETGMLFKIQGQKWFADKYLANLELGTDLTKYSGLIDHSLNLFYLKPNFTYRNDIFKIKAGINLVSQQDEFNIFPDISTSINVFGTKFTIFGGWEGGVQKNTFRQMTTFNPYLISNLDTLVATSYNRYYGGVKGIYRIFNYELQGGFKAVKNLALYLNDDTDTRRFRPLFDDANIVYFKASAGATITKGLTFLGTISQSVFDMKQERGAWHLPSLEGSAGLAYKTLSDKLSVKADVFFADGAPYKGTDGSKKRTNPLVDVNIGGDFWILENVGAFLQVNNLLNIKYQRWNNYPNYGINILGGVVARF